MSKMGLPLQDFLTVRWRVKNLIADGKKSLFRSYAEVGYEGFHCKDLKSELLLYDQEFQFEVPEKPAGEGDQQWPLAQWTERRVRRRDSDLIPLDLEVFRRENLGPKPVWKDPHGHPAPPQKRKHEQIDADEE